jgi:hypothetical protein
MEQSQIHNGLEKQEIRDFLVSEFYKLASERLVMIYPDYVPTKSNIGNRVLLVEAELLYWNQVHANVKKTAALEEIYKLCGYQRFEIIIGNTNDEGVQEFIFLGTQEERDNLTLILDPKI